MRTGHQVVRLRQLLHVLLFHRTHQEVRSSLTYTGGTLTLGNTVVGSGASLNIGAGAVCQIGANATLASAGSIVLESDGSGTAMFDDFSQAGAIFTVRLLCNSLLVVL